MTGWIAVLDAICAWVNLALVLVAVVIALLDLTVAAQRWTVVGPLPAPVRTVIVTDAAERCSRVHAPELRDMEGRDLHPSRLWRRRARRELGGHAHVCGIM